MAGGTIWRNRCLTIRASPFPSQRFANMRQLRAQLAHNRQRNHVSRSRLRREKHFSHGRVPRVESHSSKCYTQGTRPRKMLAKGGFTLPNFISNISGVLSTLKRMENPTNGKMKALAADDDSYHVLGLEWNYRLDTLVVIRGTTPDGSLTQSVVLSLVSALYGPIGLVAPYAVKAQLLLKNIWRLSGQQWDDNLPNHIVDRFVQWMEELTKLIEKTIPRSCFAAQADKVELHIFGDSSQDVFLSVAFFRGKVTSDSHSGT